MICAGDGNDVVRAMNGNDVIIGGARRRPLFGGGGHDVVLGDDGFDFIRGDIGNDTCVRRHRAATRFGLGDPRRRRRHARRGRLGHRLLRAAERRRPGCGSTSSPTTARPGRRPGRHRAVGRPDQLPTSRTSPAARQRPDRGNRLRTCWSATTARTSCSATGVATRSTSATRAPADHAEGAAGRTVHRRRRRRPALLRVLTARPARRSGEPEPRHRAASELYAGYGRSHVAHRRWRSWSQRAAARRVGSDPVSPSSAPTAPTTSRSPRPRRHARLTRRRPRPSRRPRRRRRRQPRRHRGRRSTRRRARSARCSSTATARRSTSSDLETTTAPASTTRARWPAARAHARRPGRWSKVRPLACGLGH